MNVLVVGSGGREHALVWKISRSPKVDKIYCAPGNAGIAEIAECVNIQPGDIQKLADFAFANRIALTVVGPEIPLVEGIVDFFQSKGLKIFGPVQKAALLEASKVFSKEMMIKYNVPTAKAEIFTDNNAAKNFLRVTDPPLVIKADGLAAGKGVMVAATTKEAEKAIGIIMEEKQFGESGNRIIIEECLKGEEVSFIVFTDGENIVPMVTSQDHKRVYDGGKGSNTGGMGAYSPAPVINENLSGKIIDEIIRPIISGLAAEGIRYKGVLYAGLMITDQGPKVLEFNVRYGDPETQVIMPCLKEDLVDLMNDVIDNKLSPRQLSWEDRSCVCVTCASGGYPGKYEKGKLISGLEELRDLKDIMVFHAGTKKQEEKVVTNGGRVLGVTALGKDIAQAAKRVYQAVEKIDFEGMHYRKDIGLRAIEKSAIKK
ncbi:MAG: phosphoribosylamine--glycine ligase [Candidatus Omnitrophota bacterium]|nr:phosphoribosylamine--glycine ligase [Candidatus Omnitrophota bacterium]